jgi:hypothetical protein
MQKKELHLSALELTKTIELNCTTHKEATSLVQIIRDILATRWAISQSQPLP